MDEFISYLHLDKYSVLKNYSLDELKVIPEDTLITLGLKKGPIIRIQTWQKIQRFDFNVKNTSNHTRNTRKNSRHDHNARNSAHNARTSAHNERNSAHNERNLVLSQNHRTRRLSIPLGMPLDSLPKRLFNSMPVPLRAPELRRQNSTSQQLYTQLVTYEKDRRLLDSLVLTHLPTINLPTKKLRLQQGNFISELLESGIYYNWIKGKTKCHVSLHPPMPDRSERSISVGSFHIILNETHKVTHRKFLLNYMPDNTYVISICGEEEDLIDTIANKFIDALIEYYHIKDYELIKVPPPEPC
jgi:hypothetical protein